MPHTPLSPWLSGQSTRLSEKGLVTSVQTQGVLQCFVLIITKIWMSLADGRVDIGIPVQRNVAFPNVLTYLAKLGIHTSSEQEPIVFEL